MPCERGGYVVKRYLAERRGANQPKRHFRERQYCPTRRDAASASACSALNPGTDIDRPEKRYPERHADRRRRHAAQRT